MTLLILALAGASALSLLVAFPLYLSLRHAPEGYEDQTGFHTGPMPEHRETLRSVSPIARTAVREAELVSR